MKEYLIELVQRATEPIQGRNLAREYLQACILAALQHAGAMVSLAFHGDFVRFPGLLFDLGLSQQRSEVLAVKIEVDTKRSHTHARS